MKQASLSDNDGIALVAVLLTALVLVVMLLAISMTLALSTSRSTSDQHLALQAQYAAESGLALAQSRLLEAERLMLSLQLPQDLPEETLAAHARAFCLVAALEPVPLFAQWTPEQQEEGVRLCTARPASEGGEERFSLFSAFVPRELYPLDETPEGYWPSLFAGPQARTVSLRDEGLPVAYEVRFGLSPLEVRRTETGYRFLFIPATVSSAGRVGDVEAVRATRRVQLTPAHERLALELSHSFTGWSVAMWPGTLGGQGVWQARGQ